MAENEEPRYVRRWLGEDLMYRDSPNSSATAACNHVVVVMDALEPFSMDTLKWALRHVIKPGYALTLLGVMPWLTLALSCKTWLDVWTLNLDDLEALREISEWKNVSKYQKVREILKLCDDYGVVPQMKVSMGHPLKLLILEQITYLHATWVVFDRHWQKDKDFHAKKMQCNVVMMNDEGEFDVLNVRRTAPIANLDTITPGASPALEPLIPKVIISKQLMNILKNDQQKEKSNLEIDEVL